MSDQYPSDIFPATQISAAASGGKHTFLFREGVWKMEGEYTGLKNDVWKIEGETSTMKVSGHYRTAGYLRLLEYSQMEFHFSTEMPVHRQQEYVMWKCRNLFAGSMEGRLFAFSDRMLIQYNSTNGKFSGMEHLIRINAVYYQSVGMIFRNEEKQVSWKLDLIRLR